MTHIYYNYKFGRVLHALAPSSTYLKPENWLFRICQSISTPIFCLIARDIPLQAPQSLWNWISLFLKWGCLLAWSKGVVMLRGPLSNPYLISGLALDILGYKWYTHQLNLITNYTYLSFRISLMTFGTKLLICNFCYLFACKGFRGLKFCWKQIIRRKIKIKQYCKINTHRG